MPVILAVFFVLLKPNAALCTDPAGDTLIVKKDSKWTCPRSLWENLIIIDNDLDTKKLIKLRQLFPDENFKRNTSRTTAGYKWDGNSVFFLVTLNQQDYFYFHKATTGKRLLVNLDTGTIDNAKPFLPLLIDKEKENIRLTLSTQAESLKEGKNITRHAELDGALLFTAQMGMKETRNDLDIIEEYDFGEYRQKAKVTLRRLGFPPEEFPVHLPYYVDNNKWRDKIANPAEQKMIVFAQLKQGIPSEAVYRLMGPPDYRWTTKIKEKNAFDSQMGPPDYPQSTEVEEVVDKYTKRPISSRWNAKCVAWRYDFGPQPDFSLILTWDDEGMLAKIEKVSPGLWHDNELFDDADGKPLYSGHGDVDINRIYSEHFRGKIEVVKIPGWDALATEPLPILSAALAKAKSALPPVKNIHGWSNMQVQDLQRQTAGALNKEIVFREIPEAPEMVVIPAGTFVMGSPEGEITDTPSKYIYLYERPTHLVTIHKPFAVGKTVVSAAEWNACVVDGFCLEIDKKFNLAPDSPVPVSWLSAKAYIKWLNSRIKKRTGRTGQYRLLSEAEWEYAARAGTTGPYSFEGPISLNKANYGSNNYPEGSCQKEFPDCRGKRVAVGSLPANPWGLHEMHGNISQWVEDCVHRNYTSAPTDGSPWGKENGGVCENRIFRGGSWTSTPKSMHSEDRGYGGYDTRYYVVGFRLALTLDPP